MSRFATLVAIICCAQIVLGAEVSFDELMRNPSRFHRQQVTITGIAVVGDRIDLFRDVTALRNTDLKKVITVLQRNDEMRRSSIAAPHSEANLHWVKVTGIVDTNLHGLLRDEPFGMLLERIEILPGPRLRQFVTILGYVRNDMSRAVQIKVYGSTGNLNMETGAGPREIAEVLMPKGIIVVSTLSGKPLARCELMDPRKRKQYYDPQKKAYYFRITNDGIKRVLPQDAQSWNLGYTGDRD